MKVGKKHGAFILLTTLVGVYFLATSAVISVIFLKSLHILYLFKYKVIAVLKGLTFVKVGVAGVKRFFIDNVLNKWIAKYVMDPVRPLLNRRVELFKRYNLKGKLLASLKLILPASVIGGFGYLAAGANSIMGAAWWIQAKIVVIGFFKFIWAFSSRAMEAIAGFFTNSWLAPIAEIFAISWVMQKIGKLPLVGELARWVGKKIRTLTVKMKIFEKKIFHPFLKSSVYERIDRYAQKKISAIRKESSEREIGYIEKFRRVVSEKRLEKMLLAYMEKYGGDKEKVLASINRYKLENVFVVGYFSLDSNGKVSSDDEDVSNDMWVIESIGSYGEGEVGEERDVGIRGSDFWVVNLNLNGVYVCTGGRKIFVKPMQTKLIRPKSARIKYRDIEVCDRFGNVGRIFEVVRRRKS